jgi:hypothetical protein
MLLSSSLAVASLPLTIPLQRATCGPLDVTMSLVIVLFSWLLLSLVSITLTLPSVVLSRPLMGGVALIVVGATISGMSAGQCPGELVPVSVFLYFAGAGAAVVVASRRIGSWTSFSRSRTIRIDDTSLSRRSTIALLTLAFVAMAGSMAVLIMTTRVIEDAGDVLPIAIAAGVPWLAAVWSWKPLLLWQPRLVLSAVAGCGLVALLAVDVAQLSRAYGSLGIPLGWMLVWTTWAGVGSRVVFTMMHQTPIGRQLLATVDAIPSRRDVPEQTDVEAARPHHEASPVGSDHADADEEVSVSSGEEDSAEEESDDDDDDDDDE